MLLAQRRFVITGIISQRSIAYAIAQAVRREGGEVILSYTGDKMRDRVEGFAAELNATAIVACDVSSDEDLSHLATETGRHWPEGLDGLVHAIAYAPKEAISGDFLEGLSRADFHTAHDISAYSFPAMVKSLHPLLKNRAGSVLTLTYLGAERATPNYNTMGLAKASLEASVRYLALSLGRDGIRANAISAGPIKTLAAAGIAGFSKILSHVEHAAPLKRNITTAEVADVALFLLSPWSRAITGEIIHVDSGYHIAMPTEE